MLVDRVLAIIYHPFLSRLKRQGLYPFDFVVVFTAPSMSKLPACFIVRLFSGFFGASDLFRLRTPLKTAYRYKLDDVEYDTKIATACSDENRFHVMIIVCMNGYHQLMTDPCDVEIISSNLTTFCSQIVVC